MSFTLHCQPMPTTTIDWDACMDNLFQDSDITLLFRADLDGIEDPDAELNRFYGIGDMRPSSCSPHSTTSRRATLNGKTGAETIHTGSFAAA